ncbi:RNA-directed DNA polymerase from mobile element jockey [Araneus ventricosus]|uniref:RNA-directed DNA polymerase from mobile element jockey n=1 Tax=Araneus ventricosus TaxID=182803 RepID=A0A4Y2JJS0_ARAVE|nr:RNA-directed DNA polymerase from mobile element jockey [Araneus ventricosus]
MLPCDPQEAVAGTTATKGLVFSNIDKTNAFNHNLEESFLENAEPYDTDHIVLTENEIEPYFAFPPSTASPKPVAPAEIYEIIEKLNIQNASGPDKIPVKALKLITPNVLTFMIKLFNKCLLFLHFPTAWKITNIIVLRKPGKDPKFPQNYRPSSRLSSLGKIFEKILQKRIKEH